MVAPFQYEYHDTAIHRLNPISKVLLFSTFLVLGGTYLDPLSKVPMLAVLYGILATARFPFRHYTGILLLAAFAVMAGESYIAVFMLDPAYFKIYPHAWVSTVILELTSAEFPLVGRAAITYGALLFLISFPFQVIPVILSVAGLLHTTSLSEIVSALSKLRMPFPVLFMTTVALRFIPEVVENIRLILRAQSLRGWTMETRNPIKRLRLLKPVMVPLARTLIRSVDAISMSSKNRAFGLGPVTATCVFDFRPADYVVTILSVGVTLLGIVAAFVWDVGSL